MSGLRATGHRGLGGGESRIPERSVGVYLRGYDENLEVPVW